MKKHASFITVNLVSAGFHLFKTNPDFMPIKEAYQPK